MTSSFQRAAIVMATLLAITTGAQAFQGEERESGRLYLRNFDYKEYGAHQENWAIAQDARGVMYFGNNWGVLEYDGVSWRLIRTEKKTAVLALDIDSTGTVYAGLENGFGYLAPDSLGRLRFVSLAGHLEPKAQVREVWKVHATPQGVYFLTISHLYLWANDSLSVIPITVSSLSSLVNDTLYYGEWKRGIMRIVNGRPQLLPGSEKFARVQNYLVIPFPSERTILVGHREHGLQIYRNGEFVSFPTEAEAYLKKHQLYSALNLPNGEIALGTIRGGVIIIDAEGRLKHRIDKDYGLRDQTIVSMFYDRHGGLWLAQLNGLARLELSTPLTRFDADLGVTSAINDLVKHRGVLYACTNRGVSRLSAASAADMPVFEPVDGINSFAWALYSDGSSLLAGADNGVFEIKGAKAGHIPGYPYRVRGFHRSQKQPARLYVAIQTGLGVLEKKPGGWRWLGKVRGPEKETMTLAGDATGAIWLAEKTGEVLRLDSIQPLANPDSLFAFQADTTTFGREHGFPEGQINVFAAGGRMVFASESGLYRFDESENVFRGDSTFGAGFAHPSCSISQVRADGRGNIWLLGRKDEQTLLGAAAPQENGSFIWRDMAFRRRLEIGEVRAVYPEIDGASWLGGAEGIVRFDSASKSSDDAGFRALIRSVTVKDSLIYFGSPSKKMSPFRPVLEYANNAMRFEFAAAFYDAAEANQYQYHLEDFDEGWSHWSREPRKDYTNLPEGDYRFRVRARNVYGQIGEEDIFEFTILPPWYRRWWAYGIYVAAGLAFAGGLSRTQIKRQQRRAEALLKREKEQAELREARLRAEAAELRAMAAEAGKEREKEQMRTRIASDLHDEIGSSLGSIAIISQMLEKKTQIGADDKRRLHSIHQVAEQTVIAMRDIVWFVNPVNDSMEKLFVKMRETANLMLDAIDFDFEAPDHADGFETDLSFRRNLFLIYKEILQNIVKHAQATKVAIRLQQNAEAFEMNIRDNGVGFDPQSTKKGNGSRNLAGRAKEMGGALVIESAPAKGTTIILRVEIP